MSAASFANPNVPGERFSAVRRSHDARPTATPDCSSVRGARQHRKAERFARGESKPLIKGNGGDVVRERVQEGHGALLAKLADEPGDEKRGVAFATMLGAHTDRADLNRSIEPHALAR